MVTLTLHSTSLLPTQNKDKATNHKRKLPSLGKLWAMIFEAPRVRSKDEDRLTYDITIKGCQRPKKADVICGQPLNPFYLLPVSLILTCMTWGRSCRRRPRGRAPGSRRGWPSCGSIPTAPPAHTPAPPWAAPAPASGRCSAARGSEALSEQRCLTMLRINGKYWITSWRTIGFCLQPNWPKMKVNVTEWGIIQKMYVTKIYHQKSFVLSKTSFVLSKTSG